MEKIITPKNLTDMDKQIINEIHKMDENQKIMYITEHILGATSKETAVRMEQIVEKGIELGVTEDYPRGKEDGHPWWPRTSVMMGVGDEAAVEANEEVHLHRANMKKESGGKAMFYWVDWKHYHKDVRRSDKTAGVKKVKKSEYTPLITTRTISETIAQKEARAAANPDMYVLVGSRLLSKAWIASHPEKAKELYGVG